MQSYLTLILRQNKNWFSGRIGNWEDKERVSSSGALQISATCPQTALAGLCISLHWDPVGVRVKSSDTGCFCKD